MLALFFEVTPKPGQREEYLALAAHLRPALDALGGCLFIDRFRSLQRPDTLLSFQIWRDEASLVKWRVDPQHHKVQTLGRTRIFSDYRLRVAQVIREVTASTSWQPQRLNAYNDPALRAPRYVALVESRAAAFDGWNPAESFESLYRPGEFAHVFEPGLPADVAFDRCLGAQRLRLCEVERDYGQYDRAEAPQFYAPLEKPS